MNKFVWVFLAVMYNISNALIYCDNNMVTKDAEDDEKLGQLSLFI